MSETDWTLVDFSEPKKQTGVEKSAPVFTCPKCGKPLKPRGRHFHVRKCKGERK